MTNWADRHPAEQEALLGAAMDAMQLSQERLRPSMMLRPRLFIDGDQWCALYGENIQDGVAGFGSSPAKAYLNFDWNWTLQLPDATREECPRCHSPSWAPGAPVQGRVQYLCDDCGYSEWRDKEKPGDA